MDAEKRVLMTMIVMQLQAAAAPLRIPKKAKTFFENPSYVIRFTQPFIHSWIASKLKPAEKKKLTDSSQLSAET